MPLDVVIVVKFSRSRKLPNNERWKQTLALFYFSLHRRLILSLCCWLSLRRTSFPSCINCVIGRCFIYFCLHVESEIDADSSDSFEFTAPQHAAPQLSENGDVRSASGYPRPLVARPLVTRPPVARPPVTRHPTSEELCQQADAFFDISLRLEKLDQYKDALKHCLSAIG